MNTANKLHLLQNFNRANLGGRAPAPRRWSVKVAQHPLITLACGRVRACTAWAVHTSSQLHRGVVGRRYVPLRCPQHMLAPLACSLLLHMPLSYRTHAEHPHSAHAYGIHAPGVAAPPASAHGDAHVRSPMGCGIGSMVHGHEWPAAAVCAVCAWAMVADVSYGHVSLRR
jgi:hypothetical protein